MKYSALLPLLLVGVLVVPAAASEPYKDRLLAARKVYEGYLRAFKGGTISPSASVEMLYRWSRRILEAEQAPKGNKRDRKEVLKEHLARMSELERLVYILVKTERALQADLDAVRFFQSEAEIWIEQTKAKAKK